MFKNYFLVALRNFRRNKVFSLINIAGLSIGISAALVIFLIVQYDFSFDKSHKDSDRIFRIVSHGMRDGKENNMRAVPLPLLEAVKKEVSGLEGTAPFYTLGDDIKIIVGQRVFRNQPDIILAGEQYFDIFQYQWVAGSPTSALKEPDQVVLTEGRARTYFPSTAPADIIGRSIVYFDSIPIRVVGVVKELKGNTDFIFKEFISLATSRTSALKSEYPWEDWHSLTSSTQFFIKLAAHTSPAAVEKQLDKVMVKYLPDNAKATTRNPQRWRAWVLEPLSELHLNMDYGSFDTVRQAHKPTLYGLLILGLILLVLACINFVNLTTAQASGRAREVGIRKTIGSSQRQLLVQFLYETFFLTLIATLVSLALVPVLLKVFSDFIPPELHPNWFGQPELLIFLGVLVITVSILSGFYPALVLARYRPVQVLKGQGAVSGGQTKRALLRRTLTVSQFVIAQALVIATLIVGKQIHYVLTADMGFRKEAILNLTMPSNTDSVRKLHVVLENQLRAIPGIEQVSLGGAAPSYPGMSMSTMTYNDGKKERMTGVMLKSGDSSYLSLYHIPLLAGGLPHPSDTMRELVINESYADFLGFQHPGEAIGKTVWQGATGHPDRIMSIVGVMKDFHSGSLHQAIKPLAFTTADKWNYTLHIALRPQPAGGTGWSTILAAIEKSYKALYPQSDFKYRFYDKTIEKFYKSEQDVSRLLKWATGIAIFISCLGMLGLAIYTTGLRRKEIGVRKVLGASVTQVVTLLSKDFMALVAIAILIAAPLAWWGMHIWMQDFAYRTTISWWIFGLAALGMGIIALLTLCIQTVRAARSNPVESLRTE